MKIFFEERGSVLNYNAILKEKEGLSGYVELSRSKVEKNKKNYSRYYEINEVYYDKDGKPRGWAESHNVLIGDVFDELEETYDYIQNAFKMPVIEEVDGKLIELK